MVTTLLRATAIGALLAIAAVTVLPIYARPITAAPADFERFAAFAVLGALWASAYPRLLIPVGIGLLVAVGLLELAQNFQPDRHGRIDNALVKAIGLIAGYACAAGARMLVSDLRRR